MGRPVAPSDPGAGSERVKGMVRAGRLKSHLGWWFKEIGIYLRERGWGRAAQHRAKGTWGG